MHTGGATRSGALPVLDAACGVPLVREPLDISTAAEVPAGLKAIADPARLRLISMDEGDRQAPAGALAMSFGVGPAGVGVWLSRSRSRRRPVVVFDGSPYVIGQRDRRVSIRVSLLVRLQGVGFRRLFGRIGRSGRRPSGAGIV